MTYFPNRLPDLTFKSILNNMHKLSTRDPALNYTTDLSSNVFQIILHRPLTVIHFPISHILNLKP
jgi:hypothetical protein